MKRLASILIPAAVIIILLFSSAGRKETMILSQSSDDGLHSVRIFMTGDPEFPFGSTYCRAVLYTGRSKTDETDIVLLNDGKTADEQNFRITWMQGCVMITASAEEMEDAQYILYYQ